MILNLDPEFNFCSYEDHIEYESLVFAGGEPHIKILNDLDSEERIIVTQRIKSYEDFGLLLLAIDALRRMSVKQIEVFIPYFPAGRQDRVMVPGEPLSLKVYADILNSCQLDKVTIFDPHSEVTPALVARCNVVSNHNFIEKVVDDIQEDVVLVAPDGGALKKVYKLSVALGGMEVVECSKSRDVKTGKLSGFKVHTEDLDKKTCLVVDDICDGGSTFTGLAKELKAKNSGNLYLAVSHGIFSKGFKELNNHYIKTYCTDAFSSVHETSQLRQFMLKNLI